ncbi:dihydropteroate synthase [Thermodesulfobacteriota bacterium]
MASFDLAWGEHRLTFGTRPLIMGILNVTPDSFSDGGSFFSTRAAVAQAEKMVREGADIIDIGGESTRPFSEAVSEAEEIRRVIPVIEALAHRVKIPISIDTSKAAVAGCALNAGASMINDISALRADPVLAGVAADSGVPLILMHMKGTPGDMQVSPMYDDLFSEIYTFLEQAVATAEEKGVQRSKIIIDPGIGFGKTVQHNLLLLKHLTNFKTMKLPVLIGPSRKAFVRKLLKPDHLTDIDPQLPMVETGTQATVAVAALNGADIVRVHNVGDTLATLKIVAAIQAAKQE